jgi:hypothetical protein
MNKLKNSFALGIALGLAVSTLFLLLLDLAIYIGHQSNGERFMQLDVAFAACTMTSLLLARKFFRTDEKQELGKGFLFAAFMWGAAYVYLFHISHIHTLFFVS